MQIVESVVIVRQLFDVRLGITEHFSVHNLTFRIKIDGHGGDLRIIEQFAQSEVPADQFQVVLGMREVGV